MEVISQNKHGRMMKYKRYLVVQTYSTKLFYVKFNRKNYSTISSAKKAIDEKIKKIDTTK